MEKQESLWQLIQEAREMLLDRERVEQDLIYYICRLDPEERAAIILAYQGLYDESQSTRS